jgi:hypothetical protein
MLDFPPSVLKQPVLTGLNPFHERYPLLLIQAEKNGRLRNRYPRRCVARLGCLPQTSTPSPCFSFFTLPLNIMPARKTAGKYAKTFAHKYASLNDVGTVLICLKPDDLPLCPYKFALHPFCQTKPLSKVNPFH